MTLSSLNVDVLLYLMKLLDPVDRFNIVLSGTLKGFENEIEGIDLRERIDYCEAELGQHRDSTCALEIRSLKIDRLPNESFFKILERLAEEGFLQNNRKLDVQLNCPRNSRFFEVICSMKNLETLRLIDYNLTLDVLAQVCQSCPKLTDLHIAATKLDMCEHLKQQLRPAFQRLRKFALECGFHYIYSWPVIQEMCTWLKECVDLSIVNAKAEEKNFELDRSLTLDPNLAKSLQILNVSNVSPIPAALIAWILSACFNIHTLKLELPKQPIEFHNQIARLKKLKELDVSADDASELKEIFRSCRQVEMLRVNVFSLVRRDLAELKSAENLTIVNLKWKWGSSIESVLPVLERSRYLRRLTFHSCAKISVPPFQVLSNFIIQMKLLTQLQIALKIDISNDDQLKILRDKVNELILPQRPNFQFDISHFAESS